MTELICKFCGRQAIMASRGDVILVGPCLGCGASAYEIRQVFAQTEPAAPRRRWLSSGSGMQVFDEPLFELGHEPLVYLREPRSVPLEYTIR